MTSINAIITRDGILCSSDTLITTFENKSVKKRFLYSKKTISVSFSLKSKNLCPFFKEEIKDYKIGMGFSGHVSLIENIKSRVQCTARYKDNYECANNKYISLDEIANFYLSIFNEILSEHIFNYYKKEILLGDVYKIYKVINSSCLLFGYCEIEKKHKIYEINMDKTTLSFNKTIHIDSYKVVTIGDRKEEINNYFKNEIKKSTINKQYDKFLSLFNTILFNIIIDDKYETIGGGITSYHLCKNRLIEFMLKDVISEKIRLGNMPTINNTTNLMYCSDYFFTLNPYILNFNLVEKNFKKENKDLYDILIYIEKEKAFLKEYKKLDIVYYEAYKIENEKQILIDDFKYDTPYYYRIINNACVNYDFIKNNNGKIIINRNYKYLWLIKGEKPPFHEIFPEMYTLTDK